MKKIPPDDHEEKRRKHRRIDTETDGSDEMADDHEDTDEDEQRMEAEETIRNSGFSRSDPYKNLGKLLQDAREQLQELHPELQEFLHKQELDLWCGRKPVGWWSRQKMVELVEDIFDGSEQPPEMLSPFAYNFIWRLETGESPPNRRMLQTYCYMLGFRVQIGLKPLKTPGL